MNVSLPAEMKAFVDSKVQEGAYSSTSEYVRGLIRRDQDRQRLRQVLLEGAASPPAGDADADFFAALRHRLESD